LIALMTLTLSVKCGNMIPPSVKKNGSRPCLIYGSISTNFWHILR
jgi:hypothetical protein